MTPTSVAFTATLAEGPGTGLHLVLPFEPSELWGPRARYHVRGTIHGSNVRGPLGADRVFRLGRSWCRGCGLAAGDDVLVEFDVEGPQREALAPDVVDALAASPAAAAFFDSLATFYRKGYLRWIDATKKRPDVRADRIAEMVRLLEAGHKQRAR